MTTAKLIVRKLARGEYEIGVQTDDGAVVGKTAAYLAPFLRMLASRLSAPGSTITENVLAAISEETDAGLVGVVTALPLGPGCASRQVQE